MKRRSHSLRTNLIVGVVLGLFGAITATGLSIWGIDAARDSIARATYSYEQLALVSRAEADLSRLLIAEFQRIVDPDTGTRTTEKTKHDIEVSLNRLIREIQAEAQSLRDKNEQDSELREVQSAYALRALYNNMLNGIDRERRQAKGVAPDKTVQRVINNVVDVDYARLDRIVQAVITDERTEVRATIFRLEKLNTTLLNLLAAVLAISTLLAVGSAFVTYRTLTTPLQYLTSGAQALARGEQKHRISVSGPREFVALAENFNHMARRIESHNAALTKANDNLESEVAKRTHELRDKAEQLSKVDKTRRLFFAKVSHELRTPLTVLLADAELALKNKTCDQKAFRDALGHIYAQGEVLKRRISDLINVARSEDGKIILEKTTFALDILMREIARDAEAYAHSSGVSLHVDVPHNQVNFVGDRSWLRQGLLSIIDNAIKFSPPNGDVQIVLKNKDSAIEISIEDDGPGAAIDELPRLFDPYYQASSGSARGGSGLGLAVGRWVAEHNGGKIFASNSAAGGLRISLELPKNS